MTAIVNLNPFSAVLLFGRKKNTQPIAQTSPPEETESKPKLKAAIVGKYEFAEGKLRFYAIKGVFKKRWVAINEFPADEITNVESNGNWLSINWNDISYSFLHQKKSESFNDLRDQILRLLAEQQQNKEKTKRESQLKADLTAVLNATLDTVDLSFDILMELHEKRVNWQSQNTYLDRLVNRVSWTGQTLPPLNVDLSKISDAITKQVPKAVSREALSVLKAIYGYFNSLPNKKDPTKNSDLFENAKNAMINYLMLNDVIFARVTGQKDDPEELAALDNAFSISIDKSNQISLDYIASSIQKTSLSNSDVNVDYLREIFREQITLL